MAFTYKRSSRPQSFSRSQRPAFRGPKTATINPSRYINQAKPAEQTVKQIAKHRFEDFGFDEQVLTNIIHRGYDIPTPIQDEGIPLIMNGRDVVGIANTGTGKTAAFLLPLIDRVTKNQDMGVLIVVPTRELAVQIMDEFTAFSKGMGISAALCVGGVNIYPQIQKVIRDPHFVIGTPGRLKDLILRGSLQPAMYTNVVLDEVDRMLDIGFIKDIQYLISTLPTPRSSYFFSATMTNEVTQVMHALLTDPVTVSVKTQETNDHIEQNIVRVHPGENKVDVLDSLLKNPEFERVIVFGRTKHGINKLERVLASRGHQVSAIHGNKSQNARQQALQTFKRGYAKTLLATDVAARGIDIDGVTHVINYDEPNCYEDYVHRIGRTGRAGKNGTALTFVQSR